MPQRPLTTAGALAAGLSRLNGTCVQCMYDVVTVSEQIKLPTSDSPVCTAHTLSLAVFLVRGVVCAMMAARPEESLGWRPILRDDS